MCADTQIPTKNINNLMTRFLFVLQLLCTSKVSKSFIMQKESIDQNKK